MELHLSCRPRMRIKHSCKLDNLAGYNQTKKSAVAINAEPVKRTIQTRHLKHSQQFRLVQPWELLERFNGYFIDILDQSLFIGDYLQRLAHL